MCENKAYALDTTNSKQNQKILLSMDRCPAHPVNMQLHKIHYVLSSASCTS
jgi:hypothetical protein